MKIQKEFRAFAEQKKRTGYGFVDQQQFMVLNGIPDITDNLFAIEKACREMCAMTLDMCTVFTIYDLRYDAQSNFKNLSLQETKICEKYDEIKLSPPYWSLTKT